VIVDTSVWIDYLRSASSSAGDRLEDLIRQGERIVVPEVVLLELLSGPTDEVLAMRRRRMLETFQIVANEPMVDTLRAAGLQRECRRAGETVRSLTDCLIAAVALRLGEVVLHRDHDFEVLASHCGLRTESLI